MNTDKKPLRCLKKKLAQESTQDAMCDAMLKSLLDNLASTYKTNISFSFEREKEW